MPQQRTSTPRISILIPAHNEEAVIEPTCRRIGEVLSGLACPWEILLIDDGSTDRTVEIWKDLMQQDGRLGLVRFARNFGKETALRAGLDHARGDVVVPMDADMQDPPELLPVFIERWVQGHNMVYGVRRSRDEGLAKRLLARVHYRLLNAISPITIPEEAGDFRLLDRSLVDRLRQMPESDRYHKGLYAWVGHPGCAVPYDRPARSGGQPRQSFFRLVSLALDGITGFSEAPLRILLMLGVLSCGLGICYGLWLGLALLLHLYTPPGYPTLVVLVLFFGGVQMVAIGLVGEYLARIYREVKRRPAYFTADVTLGSIR
jgi:polyisoprenyl-phosphate glycosyltransferase